MGDPITGVGVQAGCRGRAEEIGSLGISLPEASKDPALGALGVTDAAKSQAQEALLPPFPSPPLQEAQP